ncbi:MAG: response regulator [Pseudoxanthomonas suwonensis]|nr:response regulator [Pseudoxanthomonas suwonensis]
MVNDAVPHILLVEDEPVSAAFLETGISALPARVDVAASAAEALRLGGRASHDLWLLDANLPDAHGSDLLAALRRQSAHAVALAHTAETASVTHDRLREAGFAGVIVKPIGVRMLQQHVRDALGMRPSATAPLRVAEAANITSPLWDDATALTALGGDPEHVRALRALFVRELAQQREQLATADATSRHDLLHRLAASCGFVGANRLRDCIAELQRQPHDPARLQVFDEVARQTLAAAAENARMVAQARS